MEVIRGSGRSAYRLSQRERERETFSVKGERMEKKIERVREPPCWFSLGTAVQGDRIIYSLCLESKERINCY